MGDDILPGLPEQYQATILLSIGTVELVKERFIREITQVVELKNHPIPGSSDKINELILEAMGSLAGCVKELGDSLEGLQKSLAEEIEQAKGQGKSAGEVIPVCARPGSLDDLKKDLAVDRPKSDSAD